MPLQTSTIQSFRYCGKLGGLYPTTNDDLFACGKIDEVIDTCTDITNLIGGTFRIADPKEKMEARAALCAGKFPMYFKALENILKENGETGKTIAGFLVPISPFFGPHREFTIGTIFEFSYLFSHKTQVSVLFSKN